MNKPLERERDKENECVMSYNKRDETTNTYIYVCIYKVK